MIHQGTQDIINLNDLSGGSFYKDLVAAGDNSTFWKGGGQGVDCLIFYPQEVNHGNIVQCYYFFDQR